MRSQFNGSTKEGAKKTNNTVEVQGHIEQVVTLDYDPALPRGETGYGAKPVMAYVIGQVKLWASCLVGEDGSAAAGDDSVLSWFRFLFFLTQGPDYAFLE